MHSESQIILKTNEFIIFGDIMGISKTRMMKKGFF